MLRDLDLYHSIIAGDYEPAKDEMTRRGWLIGRSRLIGRPNATRRII